MKQRIFRRAARRWPRRHPRQARFVTYDTARAVKLLFVSDGTDEPLHAIVKQLAADGKQVEAWGYLPGKQPLPDDGLQRFTRRDLTPWGRPRSRVLQQMNEHEADLLVDLTTADTLPLLYAALTARAAMKVGSRTTYPGLYDFVLQPTSDGAAASGGRVRYLFDQIIFYLKNIRTSD